MSDRYKDFDYYNQGEITTASTTTNPVVGPIDISNYDRFTCFYHNLSQGTSFLDLRAQVATDPHTATGNWVNLSTATLSVPSAIASGTVVVAPVVTNTYGWLRFIGHTSATAVARSFKVTVAGVQRFN